MNTRHGSFTGPGEIRFQRLLPGSAERLWSYLIDAEKRARWLARGPLEPRVGGKLRFEFHNTQLSAPGDSIPQKYESACRDGVGFGGTVTRFEPPRVLGHTWDESDGSASEVTYELTPQGADVLLVITHRKLGDDRAVLASVGAGWHTHLALLAAELAGTPKPSFWSTHTALEREYEKLIPAPAHRP
jgi:uncharacterized protein YndB with AHSA1/START domain